MLFNKVQTKKDVAKLREIPPQKLEEILRDTPSQVLKVIADVLFVLLLKENVPLDEAEELVEKVKEKKMAELFENMEKMDIQAERRNTAEQRERAEKAEDRAEKEKSRADKEKNRADKAEAIVEKGLQLFIETCREVQLPRKIILRKLVEKYSVSEQEAEAWISKYWE